MVVLNLSPFAAKLGELTREVRFGDHSLHFEHEEDSVAPNGTNFVNHVVRCIVFCENCDSERSYERGRHAFQQAQSQELVFIETYHAALAAFVREVPESCAEARDLNSCKEVLES